MATKSGFPTFPAVPHCVPRLLFVEVFACVEQNLVPMRSSITGFRVRPPRGAETLLLALQQQRDALARLLEIAWVVSTGSACWLSWGR
jgi:hypothetical protein